MAENDTRSNPWFGDPQGSLLKPGARLVSRVCPTEVVVIRAPEGEVDLRCGGRPMVLAGDGVGVGVGVADMDADHASGTQLGKRYGDDELGIQVLCTKAGEGSLSVGGVALTPSDTKALPSSD